MGKGYFKKKVQAMSLTTRSIGKWSGGYFSQSEMKLKIF
jgi:hypothetical protein